MPNGWCKTALSEIITLLSGRDLQPTQYNSFEKGIPYITGASNIDNNTIIINRWTTAPITISHKGDLLITCKGTIGKLAFNSVGDLHIARQFMSLQFIEPLVSKYLFYCLEERISAIKQMDNGLIPGIDRSIILNQIIQLPPLAEQYRIVAEIERWFALIDTIEKSKEGLETAIKQTKSKILDLAIHGKLVPQDPKDEPASEQLRRINPKAQITCDNGHYAQLPREWSVISMQDVCKLKDGIKLDSTPLINLDVKYLRGTSAGKVIDSGKFVTANSYMILVDGENSGEVFKTPIDGYQGSTFKLLDIDQNIDEKYILNVINLHRKALRENKVGSAIPHLNKKLFKAISVPLPPYNEQVRIVEAIKSTFNLLDALKENL
ncbi:restriction endonuclease subunit S [Prevotella jejuni]|uniref:restriction endonuclease subunit S n=1 Tax=Prevotella jejuni TaxID=1177574 RepID=UPI00352FBBFD